MTIERDDDPSDTGEAEDSDPVPAPGEVVVRAAPKKDPDRFTWPPRPSLVFATFFLAAGIYGAVVREPWLFVPCVVAAVWLVMWPRVRGWFDVGGGQLPDGTAVPRVRGGVTEPTELSDSQPLPPPQQPQQPE